MKTWRVLGAMLALCGFLGLPLVPLVARTSALPAISPATTRLADPARSAPAFAADRLILQLRARPNARIAPGNTGHASLNGLMQRFGARALRPLTHPERGNAQLKGQLGLDRLVAVDLAPATDLDAALAAFAADPAIASAERDPIGFGAAAPSDTSYAEQWSLNNTGQTGGAADADIDAPEAWALTTGSPAVVVAVIDSGVDLNHPDLQSKLVAGWDFVNGDSVPQDDFGHGTHVAGIIGAASNNSTGVAGVCWQCRIMPLKALDNNNSGSYSWWISAIEYAVDHGASVINMSMGGLSDWTPLHTAIQYAANSNVPVVVAMMNSNSSTPYYPAAYSEVIAVGSTDSDDARSYFSSYGAHIDLVAPGSSILSTMWDNDYESWSGTSMATPHVTGVLGLILSAGRTFSAAQLRALLQSTADDQVGPPGEDTPGWDIYFGAGRLNAKRAVQAALDVPVATPTRTPTMTPTQTPTVTPTQTPTVTPTQTPTATALPDATPTITPTVGDTATPQTVTSPSPTPAFNQRLFLPYIVQ